MIRPYIVIPNIIEQPTWGGKYITDLKGITNQRVVGKNIGQSYELYESSNFSKATTTKENPAIEFGDPDDPTNAKPLYDYKPLSMEELVLKDPKEVLGSKPLKLYGPKMGLLLKLTQAKGNSYQIHVRNKDETTRWLFKPESWYYFEPGVLTLGVNRGVDWEAYRMTCLRINDLAFSLSEKVKSGNIEVDDARVELNDYIANHNPEAYVNRITVGPGQVVDLSACGIHHSWEEDETIAPLGNVLFEVQKNVYDPVSTIRAYDKGKIKDNGSIRELQIEDYFNYIDRSETANNPNNHFRDTKVIKQTNNLTVKNAFNTTEYSMDEIILNGLIEDEVFTTSGSFHHLFVRSGKIEVQTDNTKLTVTRGFSAFIPANTGGYRVTADKEAVILKTYI